MHASAARAPVADWPSLYLDIPFRERGRTRRGCDCRGLSFLILEEQLGVIVPEPFELYGDTDPRNGAALAAFASAHAATWAPCDVAPFAVLSFSVAGLPVHMGVAIDRRTFIHTRRGSGVQVASLTDRDAGAPRWGERLLGAYRYAG